MSEELQEQALAQEPTVERLSDDAEKVRYGYSFRQAKRCLGYTLTQEPDRSRMLAEFKALFIMIEVQAAGLIDMLLTELLYVR